MYTHDTHTQQCTAPSCTSVCVHTNAYKLTQKYIAGIILKIKGVFFFFMNVLTTNAFILHFFMYNLIFNIHPDPILHVFV